MKEIYYLTLVIVAFFAIAAGCKNSASPKKVSRPPSSSQINSEASYAFKITWKAVSGAKSYKVYGHLKGDTKAYELTSIEAVPGARREKAVVDDLSHAFKAGEEACFAVKAFDDEGQESIYSRGICTKI